MLLLTLMVLTQHLNPLHSANSILTSHYCNLYSAFVLCASQFCSSRESSLRVDLSCLHTEHTCQMLCSNAWFIL